MKVLGIICYAAMAFILLYQCVKLVQEIILKVKLKKAATKIADDLKVNIENNSDDKN